MQRLSLKGFCGGGCALERCALALGLQPAVLAISLVAHDGRADVRHVHADLVRASGLEAAFDEGGGGLGACRIKTSVGL